MGHREDVWTRQDFQSLVKSALDWSSGKADADLTPNLKDATPGYETANTAVTKPSTMPAKKKKPATQPAK